MPGCGRPEYIKLRRPPLRGFLHRDTTYIREPIIELVLVKINLQNGELSSPPPRLPPQDLFYTREA